MGVVMARQWLTAAVNRRRQERRGQWLSCGSGRGKDAQGYGRDGSGYAQVENGVQEGALTAALVATLVNAEAGRGKQKV